MNEVSCRAIETFFPALEAREISPKRLLDGLPVSLDDLHNPAKRIDWDLNVQLLGRVEELLGSDGLEEMGARSLDSAPLRLFRALGAFAADARHLYRMGCRWLGPSFFTHIAYRYRELPDGRVQVEVEIPRSYRGSRQFFEVTKGSLRAAPRLIGQPEARIEAEIGPHRAVYTIRAPRRAFLAGWLRRLARLPSAARTTVEELVQQQQSLNRLWAAGRESAARLRIHAEQLETVDHLGRELVRELGSEQLPDQVLSFLAERFHWNGASLWMTAPEEESLIFFAHSGRTQGEASHSYPLVVGDRAVGRLEVWSGGAGDDRADRELLERLLPWIAVTVLHARFAASLRAEAGAGARLRWASRSGRDLFLILDQSGRILYAGPRVDEVLGYAHADLLQMDLTELVHPDDWPRLVGDFSSLAQHSSSARCSSARVQRGDGSWRRMEGVAVKVLSEGGGDVYLISCGEVGKRPVRH